MIRPLQKESLREKAADELLRLIVSARLGPGAILSSVELARRMGISRTPVREALGRKDLDEACRHLEDNMLVGLPGILRWLDDGG